MTGLGENITAAFDALYGTTTAGVGPGADDGPAPDPFGADETAMDRRALDRTTEVFGRA